MLVEDKSPLVTLIIARKVTHARSSIYRNATRCGSMMQIASRERERERERGGRGGTRVVLRENYIFPPRFPSPRCLIRRSSRILLFSAAPHSSTPIGRSSCSQRKDKDCAARSKFHATRSWRQRIPLRLRNPRVFPRWRSHLRICRLASGRVPLATGPCAIVTADRTRRQMRKSRETPLRIVRRGVPSILHFRRA